VSELDTALTSWLPQQRWYGGKGKPVRSVVVEHEERLPGPVDVRHTLLRVTDEAGGTELYQLLLGHSDDELEPRLKPGEIGRVEGRFVFDAVHDPRTTGVLLELLAQGRSLSRLAFTAAGACTAGCRPG